MSLETTVTEGDFFRQPLREQVNLQHRLVRLAYLIDWERADTAMSASFVSHLGRPTTSPRLISGLLYLQHAFDLSDEDVVWQWLENPYRQLFAGETCLQTTPSIDPSSLTCPRKRLGGAGVELLAEMVKAANRVNVVKTSSSKRVIVDTTIMEKVIAHTAASRLRERCREHLMKAGAERGLKLRQNSEREAPRLAVPIGRYAHTKQYKRMKKALRTLRSRVGRMMRDVERQLDGAAQQGRAALEYLTGRTKRILTQKQKDENKLYVLRVPEAECVAKGKARKPNKFAVKVPTTTHKERLVIGARSMSSNPLFVMALCVPLFAVATSAEAGWYEISNYVGTIGRIPVHLSLQTYDYINRNDSDQWKVDGSYYYDTHRIPIVLQGKRRSNGEMQLCEASTPVSFGDSPKVPPASPANPVPCSIALKITDRGAEGEWRDGKNVLPIALQQVGKLDDTRLGHPQITGVIEIPMWYHTKAHLLLGVYQYSKNCSLSMVRLRSINIKTGKVDKDTKFDRCAGTVATSIYENVYRADNPHHAIVIFQGGYHGMGDDQDVPVEP